MTQISTKDKWFATRKVPCLGGTPCTTNLTEQSAHKPRPQVRKILARHRLRPRADQPATSWPRTQTKNKPAVHVPDAPARSTMRSQRRGKCGASGLLMPQPVSSSCSIGASKQTGTRGEWSVGARHLLCSPP
jgi:hypothetical protein